MVIGATYSYGQTVSINNSDGLRYLWNSINYILQNLVCFILTKATYKRYLQSQSPQSPRREPSPNPSGSTFSSDANDDISEIDSSIDKLRDHNRIKESQTKEVDDEKVSVVISSDQSTLVEKSSIGLKPNIDLLIKGKYKVFPIVLYIIKLIISFRSYEGNRFDETLRLNCQSTR